MKATKSNYASFNGDAIPNTFGYNVRLVNSSNQPRSSFVGMQSISYDNRHSNRIHKGFGQVQDTLESYFE